MLGSFKTMYQKLNVIKTRKELMDLQNVFGLRDDWHEPDEQDVTAKFVDGQFDNANAYSTHGGEQTIILKQGKKEIGRVNLAMLFAWATGYEDID